MTPKPGKPNKECLKNDYELHGILQKKVKKPTEVKIDYY